MAHSSEQQPSKPDTEQMRQLRELVLGKDGQQVKQILEDNPREMVGEVFLKHYTTEFNTYSMNY